MSLVPLDWIMSKAEAPPQWLIAWLVVSLWLALAVDRWLDRMYSQFWHDDQTRLKLRNLLGLG